MNEAQLTHPDIGQLQQFGLGKLDPPQSGVVEQHLQECPECCQTLLAMQDDTFVELVRKSEQPRNPEHESIAGIMPPVLMVAPTIDYPSRETPGLEELAPALANHLRYRVVRLLGRGGMGKVFEAEHLLMHRSVALKLINRELLEHPQAIERFEREVRAAARLSHPNIVTAYDAERAGDVHFLVMELIPGTDLADVVRQRGPLAVAEACDYARQAAAGLQHAHEHGMVHRDIKPQNLMLTPDGRVKILDFGLARLASEARAQPVATPPAGDPQQTSLTAFGALMGTPDFLAPEQSQNAHDADIRADIYSLGCTLCFLLTGRPPFPGTTAVDKVRAHAEREAIPVESLRPDLPANLAAAIRRMMARNRAGRFADPASAAAALESFDRRSDVRASTSAHRVPPGNRSWTRVALTMLAVALVAAGVIYIRLGETTLRVEINDPALAVKLDNARLTIDDRGRTVKIVPGDRHALKIEQNGLEVESDSFVLKKGEQVVLRAAVVNGRPEVAIEGASEALDRKRHHPDVPLASPVELPLAATFEGHKSYVDGIAFSPDGTWLASGSEDGTVRFWDLRTRTAGLMLTIDAQVTALAFSPEGKILAVGTGPGTVTLWNIETGRPVAALTGKLNKIHSLAFSPDGRMLASADLGGAIHLWDVATLESNRTLHQSQVPIESVAFSANGQRLAAGDYEGMIRIWDTNAWKLLQQIEGAAHDVAISANGKRIATGSRVFNAENGDVVWRFERAVPASDVAFTADGRHVVTCCYGNQLLVWNAATGNLVATASTEKRGIHELGISPDGRFVAAGGGFEYKDRVIPDGDNAVRLWALPQSVWPATK